MVERDARQASLMQVLSEHMSAGDAEALVVSATRPEDILVRKMAELAWSSLPAEAKSALGDSLDAFLADPDGYVERMARAKPAKSEIRWG